MEGSVTRRFLLGLAPWVGAVLLWLWCVARHKATFQGTL